MLPVMLNVTGKRVVVVGGGAVGMRKAEAARQSGATVWVIEANPERQRRGGLGDSHPVADAPGSLKIIPEAYRPEHLDDAFLVFACATPDVNARVVADARSRGILVCSTSDPATGDFTLPSVVRSGDLTLSISTSGAAPALARRIRERLETEFDDAFAEWVRVLAEMRAVVLAEVVDADRRRELLDSFADWSWLARMRTEGADAVKSTMLAMVQASR